jgi:group I intron endonuclease
MEIKNIYEFGNTQGIYGIKCLANNKFYIGQTFCFYNRLQQHLSRLRGNDHENKYLQRAWNKYGEASFVLIELEVIANDNSLCEREQYWINFTHSHDKNCGYNLAPAHKSGYKSSIIAKENEKKLISRLKKIISRFVKTGNFPTCVSPSEQERKDSFWLHSRRRAKRNFIMNNIYSYAWYPSLDEEAKKLGFPELFDIDYAIKYKKDKISRNYRNYCFERLNKILLKYKPDKLPSIHARGEENNDAQWLGQKRRDKINNKKWIPELEILANKKGFHGLFDLIDLEGNSIIRLQEIVAKYTPSRLPSQNSKNKEERSDAQWISSKRKAKYGTSKHWTWFPILDELASKSGFPNLFVIRDKKQEAIDKLKQILEKYTPELPKSNSEDEQEKKDACWLGDKRRQKKKNISNNKFDWYKKLDDIALEYGFVDLFNDQKRKA